MGHNLQPDAAAAAAVAGDGVFDYMCNSALYDVHLLGFVNHARMEASGSSSSLRLAKAAVATGAEAPTPAETA
jgi:hypothetical protein